MDFKQIAAEGKRMHTGLFAMAVLSCVIAFASPLTASASPPIVKSEQIEAPKGAQITSIYTSKTNDSQSCYLVIVSHAMALLTREYFCVDNSPNLENHEIVLCNQAEFGDTLQKLTIRLDSSAQNQLIFKYSINQYGLRDSASAIGVFNGAEINMQQQPNDSIFIQVKKPMPRVRHNY